MKKQILIALAFLVNFAFPALAYDFQAGNLLYTIIGTDPPEVSVYRHIDGTMAQGQLVIPETVEHEGVIYDVTIIGKNAFNGCELLSGNIVIPNSVREILAGAFYNCKGFSGDLVIPNSVLRINIDSSPDNTVPGAFENCTGFDGRLVLSNSLEIIGDAQGGGCFSGCCNLIGELELPYSIKYIGKSAFCGCGGFTGVLAIPESVDEISHNAFSSCLGIENVIFPNTPFQMGDQLFAGCTGLTDIYLPEGWFSTGAYTFTYCTGLKSVLLPESMVEIERGAFSNCHNLLSINFPDALRMIGNNAFGYCSKLINICLPDSLEVVSISAFSHCDSLYGRIVIPDKVEELPWFAFSSCTGITKFVLGKSIQYISECAFEDTTIDTIMLRAIVPPELDRRGVWHFPEDVSIIVPCGTLEAYQNAEGWSDFTNIQEGNTYIVSVSSENEALGETWISKEAICEDMSVEVEAIPNEGCSFLYWEADGEQVLAENPYSFILERDTRLVAHFSGTGVAERGSVCVIYPNPARNQLRLQYSPDVQPKLVELYDLQGRLVRTQRKSFETLNLQGLATGQYVMKVAMEDGKTFTDKVVKE